VRELIIGKCYSNQLREFVPLPIRASNSVLAKEVVLEEILIFRKFHDDFPNELLNLSPGQEIEFSINLLSRIAPISTIPYDRVTSTTEGATPIYIYYKQ
jgi:hypothetical protein